MVDLAEVPNVVAEEAELLRIVYLASRYVRHASSMTWWCHADETDHRQKKGTTMRVEDARSM